MTGTVTYKEVPLEHGTISFQPSSGPFASADIQSDGTFHLMGEIGENTVMIVCRDNAAPATAGNVKGPKPKSIIPEAYGTPKSGLSYTVEPGENEAHFELK